MTNKIDKIQMPDGQVLKLNGGSGLEVCDISMALYVDETKGLRRYLNGQIVDINANTQAFLNRLLEIKNTNPDYFATEENWQAEALLNIDGCVYKFVLNYSGETVVSVRLPKYPDYVEINAGGTLPVVGNGMTLGITNGSGTAGFYHYQANTAYVNVDTGRYGTSVGGSVSDDNGTLYGGLGVTTDATKSGIQTTLKQTKLKMRYFIQIATGAETENNIINEIELNNPFSLFDSKYSDHELNNLSWLKSEGQWNAKSVYPTAYDKLLKVYNGTETVEGLSVKLSTETYTDYDFVLNTTEETFRLPLLDGSESIVDYNKQLQIDLSTNTVMKQDAYVAISSINITSGYLYINDQLVLGQICNAQSYAQDTMWKLNRGDTVRATGFAVKVYACKGNGYLYFYVGETVQNANLIDAGRIGEQLATKTDMLQASGAGMPSNRYIDLTLGASDATYTAPANGYVQIVRQLTSNAYTWQVIGVLKDGQTTVSAANTEYREGDSSTSNSATLEQLVPVKSGRTFFVSYGGGSVSVVIFRFIYAEGSKEV